MKKLLVIDGNSIANRAFYGVPALSNSQGVVTNAVYGFLNMFNNIREAVAPDMVAVTFDVSKKVFRHELYTDYKGTRKPMPDDLRSQMPLIKEALTHMNVAILTAEGYEADDVIGTLATWASDRDINTIIVSGDRDLYQLINDKTMILFPRRGLSDIDEVDLDELEKEYGLTPPQVIDLIGLKGDSSDNIPGIPGVGEKTARKFLDEYGSIDNLYEHIDDFKGKKMYDKLVENKDIAYLSRELATIDRQVPITIDEEMLTKQEPNVDALLEFYKKMEFRELAKPFLSDSKNELSDKKQQGEVVENRERMLEILAAEDTAFFILNPFIDNKGSLQGIDFSCDQENYRFMINDDADEVLALFKPYLESAETTVVTEDAKALYHFCFSHDIDIKRIGWDINLSHYLLDPDAKDHDIDHVYYQYYNETLPTEEPLRGFAKLSAIKHLMVSLSKELDEKNLTELYLSVELPLSSILAKMEIKGIGLDVEYLETLDKELEQRLSYIKNSIFDMAGESFNLNSPKQLGVILFEKLNLPVIKRTKTGYSTSAEVLEALEDEHPIIKEIFSYRELSKLKSTYVQGLLSVVDPDDVIHTTFTQTITATGRLSSVAPNIQNIPVRTEEGRRIRQAFIPKKDRNVLVSADYSQIELRILAHLSGDNALRQSFLENEDIHRRTASEVFHIPIDQVTSGQRRIAKAVNFGIIYGQSDYGLAKELHISRKDAKAYIDSYFTRYPDVRAFIDACIEKARKDGYVTTILDRKRYIKDIHSKNFNLRSFAERTAVNSPIQGSAADIIKLAMIDVDRQMNEEGFQADMILQVHDELIFEVPPEEVSHLIRVVRAAMENAVGLEVPLKTDFKVGFNWNEMESV